MKIYVVCTLYNQKITAIKSLAQFLQLAENYPLKIFIEDNSDEAICCENKQEYDVLYKDKIIYECNHANLGLSKAYNKAISKMEDESWVMLIDDDTYFSAEYLRNSFNAAISAKAEVISGIVCCQNGYMSPTKRQMIMNSKENFITHSGVYDDIYCINSGLMYKVSLIHEIGGYDEDLFLDMVDNWFMEKLKIMGKNRILVVQGEIKQLFSGAQPNGFKADLNRFKIFERDFGRYCKMFHKSRLFYNTILYKHKVGIIVKNLLKSAFMAPQKKEH